MVVGYTLIWRIKTIFILFIQTIKLLILMLFVISVILFQIIILIAFFLSIVFSAFSLIILANLFGISIQGRSKVKYFTSLQWIDFYSIPTSLSKRRFHSISIPYSLSKIQLFYKILILFAWYWLFKYWYSSKLLYTMNIYYEHLKLTQSY